MHYWKENYISQACREWYSYDAITAMANVLFIHNMQLVKALSNDPWKKICRSKIMLSKPPKRVTKATSHPIDINLNKYLIKLAVFWPSVYRTGKVIRSIKFMWCMTMANCLHILLSSWSVSRKKILYGENLVLKLDIYISNPLR